MDRRKIGCVRGSCGIFLQMLSVIVPLAFYIILVYGIDKVVGNPVNYKAGAHSQEVSAEMEPIDFVYTWVNGSDPRHLSSACKTSVKFRISCDFDSGF